METTVINPVQVRPDKNMAATSHRALFDSGSFMLIQPRGLQRVPEFSRRGPLYAGTFSTGTATNAAIKVPNG